MKLLKSFTTILRFNSSLLSPACARNEAHCKRYWTRSLYVHVYIAINPHKYTTYYNWTSTKARLEWWTVCTVHPSHRKGFGIHLPACSYMKVYLHASYTIRPYKLHSSFLSCLQVKLHAGRRFIHHGSGHRKWLLTANSVTEPQCKSNLHAQLFLVF